LKNIDQSSNGKGYDGKSFQQKWKSFKKTLRIMEKKASMERQSPSLWGVTINKYNISIGISMYILTI
jgi:hypothetical protein